MPQVVARVRQAGQDVVARGLDRLSIPTLEARFDAVRALGGDSELSDFLRSYTTISDFSELSVTERHGFNVLLSGQSPDFAQGDETWWQRAMRDGSYEGEPQSDTTGTETALEFDVAIHGPQDKRPLGVLQALFSLERLTALLGTEELAGRGAYLRRSCSRSSPTRTGFRSKPRRSRSTSAARMVTRSSSSRCRRTRENGGCSTVNR